MMRFRPLVLALSIALAPSAAARAADGELVDLGMAKAISVGADGTVALADGRMLRLAGVALPAGTDGKPARAAIAELIALGPLALKGDGAPLDRYGRTVAQAYAADGRWLEGELLRQGSARVATAPDHRAAARELLAAERTARSRRLGVWNDPAYAVRDPDDTARLLDTWQVVEGTVRAERPGHGAVYLEFGDAPGNSLGVRIPEAVARDMAVDPDELRGRKVVVRGWIGKGIGPLIVLDHAEQIEPLGRARRDG